jgi:hypothetical protein
MKKSEILFEISRNRLLMGYKSDMTADENKKFFSEKKYKNTILIEKVDSCEEIKRDTPTRVKEIYKYLSQGKEGHLLGAGTNEENFKKGVYMIQNQEELIQLEKYIKCMTGTYNSLASYIWSEFKTTLDTDANYLRKFDNHFKEVGINLKQGILCYDCVSPDTEERENELEKLKKDFVPKWGSKKFTYPYPKGSIVPQNPYVDIEYSGNESLDIELWNQRMERNKNDDFDGSKYGVDKQEIRTAPSKHNWYGVLVSPAIYVDPPENWAPIQQVIDKQKESISYSQYPNYCPSKHLTLPIPENPAGAEGQDAAIKGHCYYRSSKDKGVWINSQSPELVPSDQKNAEANAENILKKYEIDPKEKEIWVKAWKDEFPQGCIIKYKLPSFDEQWITSYYKIDKKNKKVTFTTFKNVKTNEVYMPTWKDERTTYEKTVDKFGFWAQIGAAAVFFIAGLFTEGTTWFIAAEIITELGLGSIVGYRELEKGQNAAAALSFVFAMIPMLKMNKIFQGDVVACRSIAKKLAQQSAESLSTPEGYAKFYDDVLDETEKYTFSKFMSDPFYKTTFEAELKAIKGSSAKEVMSAMSKVFKNNPAGLKSLKLIDKMWFKEIVLTYAPVTAVYFIYTLIFDTPMPPELEQDLSGVFEDVPDNYSIVMASNLASNTEIITELVGDIMNNKELKDIEDNQASAIVKSIQIKESLEKRGKEFQTNDTIPSFINNVNSNAADSLKNLGYKPFKEWNPSSGYNIKIAKDQYNKTWYINENKK